VPPAIRRKAAMQLPPAASEVQALDELRELARRNRVLKSFIGQGYYGTYTPTVILRNVLENPAWYTAYTPYQAEISQGRLEALLNFQTMVCDLTAMPLANASMLDEASACAEAMALARRVGVRLLDGKPVAPGHRLLYALGDLCIYAPLRNALGLSRVRVAYTAGAAIGPDLFGFFRSIGVNLKQIYGHTETCGYVCMQRDGQVSVHDVGRACPGMEVQLADSGEVLVRGPAVLKAYYERPEATAEVLDMNGWFHTGDAGVLDAQGCLRIWALHRPQQPDGEAEAA